MRRPLYAATAWQRVLREEIARRPRQCAAVYREVKCDMRSKGKARVRGVRGVGGILGFIYAKAGIEAGGLPLRGTTRHMKLARGSSEGGVRSVKRVGRREAGG